MSQEDQLYQAEDWYFDIPKNLSTQRSAELRLLVAQLMLQSSVIKDVQWAVMPEFLELHVLANDGFAFFFESQETPSTQIAEEGAVFNPTDPELEAALDQDLNDRPNVISFNGHPAQSMHTESADTSSLAKLKQQITVARNIFKKISDLKAT